MVILRKVLDGYDMPPVFRPLGELVSGWLWEFVEINDLLCLLAGETKRN